jgi:uncharacterized protein (TIGR02246 family)
MLRSTLRLTIALVPLCFATQSHSVLAQPAAEAAAPSPDEEAIQQAAVKFVEAYGKKDTAAMLALFTPDARMEEADGTVFEGTEELEAAFKEDFEANPKAALGVTMDSIRFVTPDVAVEEGSTQFFPDGELLTSSSRYLVVHLKKDGAWRMASVRSVDRDVLSNYEMLRDLEWLVGDWVDEGIDGVVQTSCRWDENKSYLLQDFSIRREGEITAKGTQRIGWDPQAKHYRAWIFDDAGGFGEARWVNTGDAWVSKVTGMSNDGVSVSATRTFRLLDKDHIIVSTTDRLAGDESLPDFEITLTRKPPAPDATAAR